MTRPPEADETSRGRPAGVPLGRAFVIRSGIANDDLRGAIAAASRVHGDGELPTIPILLSGAVAAAGGHPPDGTIRARVANDGVIIPVSIQVRDRANHRQYVALHEIGHFLDANGLPGPGYSSMVNPALGGWRRAVIRSRASEELEALRASGDPAVSARATILLREDELWARSYAQFIIIRGGGASLRARLDAFRRREPGDIYFPRQWEGDDFGEIELAIDRLFRRLGSIA